MGQMTEMSHWQISQQKKSRHNVKLELKLKQCICIPIYIDQYCFAVLVAKGATSSQTD